MVKRYFYRFSYFTLLLLLLGSTGVYAKGKYVEGELIVKYQEYVNSQVLKAAAGQHFTALSPFLNDLHKRHGLKEMHRVIRSLDRRGLNITGAASFKAHVRNSFKRSPHSKSLDPGRNIPNLHNIYQLKFKTKTSDMEQLAKEYERDASVEYAHPNYILELSAVPNDPDYNSQQWAHPIMSSEPGWDLETGSSSVVIAVIDTGVDWDHPDLSANIWSNSGEIPGNAIDDDSNGFIDDIRGWDFVDSDFNSGFAVAEDIGPPDNDPMDFYGHGTLVAGAAAAVGNNSVGLAGTAWNCAIMPLRVGVAERDSGNAYIITSWTTAAMYYAGNNGADVISFAIVDNNWPSSLKDAIDAAYGQGAVIVSGAGNYGKNGAAYPAAYPKVIGVAATDQSDQRAIWGVALPPFYQHNESNFGAGISVAAPGSTIYSTAFNDGYGTASGTSMSEALVCGLAGLIRSRFPAMNNADVMKVIYSTTDPVTSDKYIGTGRVNVNQALQMSSVPVAEITNPGFEALLGANIDVIGSAGGTNFNSYLLQYGQRFYPGAWTTISTGSSAVTNGILGNWNIDLVPDNLPYTLRLTVNDTSGNASISEVIVYVQKNIQTGWPQAITENFRGQGVAVGDVNNDGDQEVVLVAIRPLGGPQHTHDLYVFNSDGSQALGWPVTDINRYVCAPTLADLTFNGRLNIIMSGYNWGFPNSTINFYVFDDQGSAMPGWPVSLTGPEKITSQTPSVGDLNNDGNLEIVFPAKYNSAQTPMGKIYVYRSNGTPLPGWPVTIDLQFPLATGTAQDHVSHAALADFDNDGDLEIVVCVNVYGNCHMYVYHHDGTVATGWPVTLGHGYTVSPVVGDVDNDGDYEIIGTTGNGWIYGWNFNGTAVPGWPVNVASTGHHDPALADLDGNGDLEVVFHSTNDQVYAYHHNGTVVTGWPQSVSILAGGYEWSSPRIGDITGDSQPEILLPANHETMIYAWHADGSTVLTWPKVLPNETQISPALTDLNQDGTLDLVLAYANNVNLWTMSIPYQRDDLEWPMSWFNMHHTATYTRDIQAPSVSITNPIAGATVINAVNIIANASDNAGVMGVRFKVDGNNIGVEDTIAPYSIMWDSTTVSNGNHVLTALARDGANNQTLSTGISITVANTTPSSTASPAVTVTPTITITATITTTASTTATSTPSSTPFAVVGAGEIIVMGSVAGKGAINPDRGETVKIYFKAKEPGRIECKIFTLIGEMVWREEQTNLSQGLFEWRALDTAPGIYVVFVQGPGLSSKKKIAILR